MAGLALGILVLITQHKLRIVMIKAGRFPATLVVTGLAFFAQAVAMPFFLIVLLVACDALGRQLRWLIEHAFIRQMAGIAFGLLVLALEGVMRIHIMTEGDFLPAFVVVTGLAFNAVTTLMPFFVINFFVTAITGQRRLLIGIVRMALLALDFSMLATEQRKF